MKGIVWKLTIPFFILLLILYKTASHAQQPFHNSYN